MAHDWSANWLRMDEKFVPDLWRYRTPNEVRTRLYNTLDRAIVRPILGTFPNAEVYIYQLTQEDIKRGGRHQGRNISLDKFLHNPNLTKLLVDHNLDVVFKVVLGNDVRILKVCQLEEKRKKMKGEYDISRMANRIGLGPAVYSLLWFGRIPMISEEYLGHDTSERWTPLYLSSLGGKFPEVFGARLGALHENNTIFNDDLYSHLLVNSTHTEAKLIDYGAAYVRREERSEIVKDYECVSALPIFVKRQQSSKIEDYFDAYQSQRKFYSTSLKKTVYKFCRELDEDNLTQAHKHWAAVMDWLEKKSAMIDYSGGK